MRAATRHILFNLTAAWIGISSAGAQPPLPAAPGQAASQPTGTVGVTPRDEAALHSWLVDNGLVRQVSSRATDLVTNAMSFLGVKYRWGGGSTATGFDCSGFVRYVYQETVGTVLPHNAAQQSHFGEKVQEDNLKPGDLVFFNTLRRAISHVGIYVGNGEFIHAPRSGETIRIENLDSPYWAKRFAGARRLLNGAPPPTDDGTLNTDLFSQSGVTPGADSSR